MFAIRRGTGRVVTAAVAIAVAAVVLNAPSAAAGTAHAAARPAAAPQAAGTKDAYSGVGYADRDDWGTWRGQPVQTNETWNDAKDSSGNLAWGPMDALYTVNSQFGNNQWGGELSVAQPMYASNESVNSCASDSEITTWAQDLKTAWPRADAFIRLGWEFNGNWYSWQQGANDYTAFKSCWTKWYTDVKAVSSNFKLVWNPNAQSSSGSLDVRKFWPGAQYVDAAGPDLYALGSNGTPESVDATGPNGEPLGIEAWRNWIAQQGVPFTVPEWGINDVSYGSTSPTFIDQMRTAFQEAAASPTGLAYEDYFDGGSDFGCQFAIHDTDCSGDHADAAAEYQKLWKTPYSISSAPTGTLPRSGWAVSTDSQETSAENGSAANAIDGDATTYWHTQYSGSAPAALPHTFTIDMHATHTVTGLDYQPRAQGGIGMGTENGRIGQYQIAVSTDGTTWKTVASGTWADDATTKTATFAATSDRYVRLTALSEAGNRGPWSSAAEINVLGS